MASYQKLPSGNWRALFYTNGKRKSLTRPTKRECQKAVEQYEFRRNGGMTVGDLIKKFIADRENILSPYTITGYRTIQRNAFLALQNCRVDNLTERMIIQAVNEESAVKSPKTVRNALALFLSALRGSVDVSSWDIPLPQKARKEIVIPTDEQLSEVIEKFAGTEMEIPILLAAYCGLRRSEICAIDVNKDIRGGYLWINKSVAEVDGGLVFKAPKTDAGYRWVELPDFIAAKIKQKGYITHLTPKQISNRFRKVTKGDFSFHSLRHYYCSNAMLVMPTKYVMERMGHSTETMTKAVYQHIIHEADSEYGKKLVERLNELHG